MFDFRLLRGVAVSLATLGMMVPQARVFADSTSAKAVTSRPAPINQIPDLVLTDNGTMSGRVCDHGGRVIEGATVTLKQDKKLIGTTTTDKDGVYSFKNLKPGVYNPSCGNTEGVFRVWSQKVAPPSAKEHALLVLGENGARGQFGGADPTLILLTAGVIATTVLSAITLTKIDDVNKKVDKLSNSP